MQHRSVHPAAPGFSLIELVMVVAVVAIASALIVPRLGSDHRTRLVWAAEMLAADLQAAQSESMAHPDDPRVITMAADGTCYGIAAASDPTVPITNPLDGQPWMVHFGKDRGRHIPGVVMPTNNVGNDLVLGFGAYGEPDQDFDAVFVLGADSAIVRITVDAQTGRITIGPLEPASNLSVPLPGPVTASNSWGEFINALLSGNTSGFNWGNN